MRKSGKMTALMDVVKLIFGLAAMVGMAYVFTFYLDADIGVVVFAFLILAPLFSLLLAWNASRNVTVKLEAPDTLQKGRRFSAKVTAVTESRLPVPFLRVGLAPDPAFSCEDLRMVQSAMTSAEPLEIPFAMTARYSGSSMISAGQAVVCDYLGLFRFRLKEQPAPVKVGVIPAIPSLTGAGLLLHNVSDIVLTADEEEEETNASFSAQTMPGYVHRDYVPGDNLRRINWKLSAKRNRLMVRMDEAASAVRPTVILDFRPEVTEEGMQRREILMEGALGFLMLLVRQGVACTLHFPMEGGWRSLLLETEDAVESAAVELAAADFIGDGSRVDPAAMQEHAFLIYSTSPDAGLAGTLHTLHDTGYTCLVIPVSPEVPEQTEADALWQLAEDYSMTALQK